MGFMSKYDNLLINFGKLNVAEKIILVNIILFVLNGFELFESKSH